MVGSHEDTRGRLLRAAAEVFAEVGYQAATVREICARAGVNVAAINYHFRDKLGLYTALLRHAAEESQAHLEHVECAETPEEALRRFVYGMLRHLSQMDRAAWYARMMAHELVQPTPALAEVVEHVIGPKAQVLYGIVGRLLGRPPADLHTRMCASSIMGQVSHFVHARPVLSLLWPEFRITEQTAKEITDHIIAFSLHAIRGMRRARERELVSLDRPRS